MDWVYVPPQHSTCESYWMALLEEGPLSDAPVPGLWEWREAPPISSELWDEAERLHRDHVIMQLTIEDYNRGGLIGYWKGIECFIPASHLLAYPFPADPTAREECFKHYLGRDLRLCIIEVEPTRNRILFSERQVEACEGERRSWPDWLRVGAICEGEITSVRPFGAFINLGPLEGMVHISEISWGRVRHPKDFIEPGQRVRALVLSIDEQHQRVGLSLKRLEPNPWDSVQEWISPGDELPGRVVSVERFGVFLELGAGLEGLLHISELCRYGTDSAIPIYQRYRLGDVIPVRVLDIVPEEHRIALGLCESRGEVAGNDDKAERQPAV
ncbi:MAG TPA: S1 RNA-binding domain-containing protein [Anaerolineae bacterium]|nr:S1 RNA-binding domain-containing protein [Anaerolineae bacterium]HRT31173.1 S1 RNA-binding domain-containing protein [Anaerolineae bacterium]